MIENIGAIDLNQFTKVTDQNLNTENAVDQLQNPERSWGCTVNTCHSC